MEPVTYRLGVLLERAERLSYDLDRAKLHLVELEAEARRIAADLNPAAPEVR